MPQPRDRRYGQKEQSRFSIKAVLFCLIIVLPVIALSWVYGYQGIQQEQIDAIIPKKFHCMSLAPDAFGDKGKVEEAEIRFKLEQIRKVSPCVRIYSVTQGMEHVPRIAKEFDMQVIAGAWLSENLLRNDREIASLINIAKTYDNIKYLVVGNEVLLFQSLKYEELEKNIQYVRKSLKSDTLASKIPITTAEPLAQWVIYPELFDIVDVAGVHKLSFWEGEQATTTPIEVFEDMELIEFVYEKPVVLLEVGWPTNGPGFKYAKTGLHTRAWYLSQVDRELQSRNIFYNVVEAFDIPAKAVTTEGLVGIHWGIFNTNGSLKELFPLTDALLWLILYIVLIGSILIYDRKIIFRGAKSILALSSIVLLASGVATIILEFHKLYLNTFPLYQSAFMLLLFYAYFEISQKILQLIFASDARKYLLEQIQDERSITELEKKHGKVSILIAAKDELAEQTIKTLSSCLAQTYPNIEIIFVDNNSKSDNEFKKVEEYFKNNPAPTQALQLIFEKQIAGFKAGALNLALKHVSVDSQYIAVLDSDYVTSPQWIETALRYIKPETGFVQFPQAYAYQASDISSESYASEVAKQKKRERAEILQSLPKQKAFQLTPSDLEIAQAKGLKQIAARQTVSERIEIGASVEQNFVFDVIYPLRALIGTIVQNGTLVVMPRKYFENGNESENGENGLVEDKQRGWPTYSICEDAALGARIAYEGGVSTYVPLVMGTGVSPHTFKALKKQRFRWVFGSMQILKFAITHPKQTSWRTMILYAIDWLGWLMHGLYPLLLAGSFGLILFVWLVYLHTMFTWVIYTGIFFAAGSLILFIATYIRTYVRFDRVEFLKSIKESGRLWENNPNPNPDLNSNSKNLTITGLYLRRRLREIWSLLIIECALVNTICAAVWASVFKRRASFTITRGKHKISISDLSVLAISTALLFGAFCLSYIVMIWLEHTLSLRLILLSQLAIVLIPQVAYFYLIVRE